MDFLLAQESAIFPNRITPATIGLLKLTLYFVITRSPSLWKLVFNY